MDSEIELHFIGISWQVDHNRIVYGDIDPIVIASHLNVLPFQRNLKLLGLGVDCSLDSRKLRGIGPAQSGSILNSDFTGRILEFKIADNVWNKLVAKVACDGQDQKCEEATDIAFSCLR